MKIPKTPTYMFCKYITYKNAKLVHVHTTTYSVCVLLLLLSLKLCGVVCV